MTAPVTPEDVRDFLIADGYSVSVGATGVRMSAKGDASSGRGNMEIWLPTIREPRMSAADLERELRQSRTASPDTSRVVLLPTMTELGTDFLKSATDAKAFVRTFGFFFDAPYRQGGAAASGEREQARQAARFFRGKDLFRPELLVGTFDLDVGAGSAAPVEWRVPQPYCVQTSIDLPSERNAIEPDLLRQLVADCQRPIERVRMTLVVGPAGIGKSILFSALFTWMYNAFQRAKQQQKLAPRPIAVLPHHLATIPAFSTGALLEAITQTVGARPMGSELLDWSLRTGRCVLLCDGLDEFFAEQTDFLPEIDRRHLRGGRAQYYIFLRDSLLTTSASLRNLMSQLMQRQGTDVRIYRMVKWSEVQGTAASPADPRRTMVWLRREGRRPKPGDVETAQTHQILERMQHNPVVWELASLPLFCELLITKLSSAGDAGPIDEYTLLDYLLEQLASREWDKLAPFDSAVRTAPEDAFISRSRWAELTSWAQSSNWALPLRFGRRREGQDGAPAGASGDVVGALSEIRRKYGTEGLFEVLEEVAFDFRCGKSSEPGARQASGLKAGDVSQRYQRRMAGLEEGPRSRGERILTQFALFTQGKSRTIDFAHPIIADYLAARYAIRRLKRTTSDVCQLLDHVDPDDARVFFGYLRREVKKDAALGKRLGSILASARLSVDCKERLNKVLAV